jgi:hypothetical protein
VRLHLSRAGRRTRRRGLKVDYRSVYMATLRGWAPCGMRLPAKVPHGHWKTTTFLAALRTTVAPWVLDGKIDGESFQIYVEKILLPTPKQGDIVIMDNLGDKGKTVRAPKYSPDLNPIEQVLAKLKHLLRKASAPSTLSGLQSVSCSQPSPQRNAPTTSKAPDTASP